MQQRKIIDTTLGDLTIGLPEVAEQYVADERENIEWWHFSWPA